MTKVIESFDMRTNKPLDKRSSIDNLNSIDRKYDGLMSFQKSDNKFYKCVGGIFTPFDKEIQDQIDTLVNDFTNYQNNNNFVNVKDFGAKCDGVTDDYTAIQACINSVGTNGGGTVFIPKTCLTGTTIKLLYSNVRIMGKGSNISQIVGIGAVSPILQLGDATHGIRKFSLENIGIERNLGVASKVGTIGLFYMSSFHPELCSIKDCCFSGSSINVKLGDSSNRPEAFTSWVNCEFGNYDQVDDYAFYVISGIEQKFINCRFQGFDNTGFCVPSTANSPNDFMFLNCYFGSVTVSFGGAGSSYAISIQSGFCFYFNNCITESGKEADVFITGGRIIRFNNCMIGGAGWTGYGFYIIANVADITDVSIIGCEIRDFGQTNSHYVGTGKGIYATNSTFNASFININGNTIRSDGSSSIRVDSAHTVVNGNIVNQLHDEVAILLTTGADGSCIVGNVVNASLNTSGNSPISLSTGVSNTVVTGNSIIKGSATNGVGYPVDSTNVIDHNSIV